MTFHLQIYIDFYNCGNLRIPAVHASVISAYVTGDSQFWCMDPTPNFLRAVLQVSFGVVLTPQVLLVVLMDSCGVVTNCLMIHEADLISRTCAEDMPQTIVRRSALMGGKTKSMLSVGTYARSSVGYLTY